jgi:hypothetical protein
MEYVVDRFMGLSVCADVQYVDDRKTAVGSRMPISRRFGVPAQNVRCFMESARLPRSEEIACSSCRSLSPSKNKEHSKIFFSWRIVGRLNKISVGIMIQCRMSNIGLSRLDNSHVEDALP